jgi:sugar lactone lactonase YvrE
VIQVRSVAAALCAAVACSAGAAPAQARSVGDTRVFAGVPEPGQPAGIAVDGDRVLVSTAGATTQALSQPRLFVYGLGTGRLRRSHVVPKHGSHSGMALLGIAVDAARRAYVVDMNGVVLRVDPESGRHEHYATFPAAVGGMSTMPFDIVFDEAGFAYVTDQNLAAIWRIPPGGGEPRVWFQDLRLFGYLFGAAGIRIDPSGKYVYFTVAMSQHPATPGAGIVYRLPLVEHPTPAQLQEVFHYETRAQPFGIAFGASGKLYVALAGPSQVSILHPGSGIELQEEKRFPTVDGNRRRELPYEDPMGVAFDGCGSLLVTNSTVFSAPNPERWVVFDAFVGDTAAPLARPVIGGASAPRPSAPACGSRPKQPRRCLARRSPIGPRNIGRVRLGYTRKRVLRRVGAPPVRRARHAYSWCVKRSRGRVSAVFGARGRSVLVTSTARGHGNRRVRPGVHARVVRRAYPGWRPLARGTWLAGPRSRRLIGVRSGRVRFVGVAARRLLGRPRLLVRQLRPAGL